MQPACFQDRSGLEQEVSCGSPYIHYLVFSWQSQQDLKRGVTFLLVPASIVKPLRTGLERVVQKRGERTENQRVLPLKPGVPEQGMDLVPVELVPAKDEKSCNIKIVFQRNIELVLDYVGKIEDYLHFKG